MFPFYLASTNQTDHLHLQIGLYIIGLVGGAYLHVVSHYIFLILDELPLMEVPISRTRCAQAVWLMTCHERRTDWEAIIDWCPDRRLEIPRSKLTAYIHVVK